MKKEDARVKKTKEKLFEAFRNLLADKTYEDITVNEICTVAGIRRATFYKHFTDKHDFMSSMAMSLIQRFDSRMSRTKLKSYPVEYHVEYVRRLVRFLVENGELVNSIFKSKMLASLVGMIVQENYKILCVRLAHSVENGEKLVASIDTTATLLAGGIGSIIVKWFEAEMPTSQEELTTQIESIVKAMFI